MKRIYIILPKRLKTDPPVKVDHGFGMAQVHHGTVLACKKFNLSEEDAVAVLQVPDNIVLAKLFYKLAKRRINVTCYWETSHRFEGKILTCLVTDTQPRKMKIFKDLKLWS